MPNPIVCTLKQLPRELWVSAAKKAAEINPINHAPVHRLMSLIPNFEPTTERIAIVTTEYWHAKGVRLTVGFFDGPSQELRAQIVSHMNAWSIRTNRCG
jgi:hypothetical protein